MGMEESAAVMELAFARNDRRAEPGPRGGGYWPWSHAVARATGRPSTDVEDLLEVGLYVLLVAFLRDGKLLDEERARCVEHLPFAEGEILVRAEQVQISKHFRDLEQGAGLDLVHVLAVAPVPGGGVDRDLFLAQDGVDASDFLLSDDLAQAYRTDLVHRDHDLHPVVQDAEHVEGLPLTGDLLVLDTHDLSHPLPRVDRLVPNLEIVANCCSLQCGHQFLRPSPSLAEPSSLPLSGGTGRVLSGGTLPQVDQPVNSANTHKCATDASLNPAA